jgi:hypothetical protein
MGKIHLRDQDKDLYGGIKFQWLVLASAVILGSESLGTRDHILLSQIRDFLFRRLLRLAGLWWRYSTPPPHGDPNIGQHLEQLIVILSVVMGICVQNI